MSFIKKGALVVWNSHSNNRLIDADEATVTFDPSTGRLSASGPGFEIVGNIQRSRGIDRSESPTFLSCTLDDGTYSLWGLYEMTDSERVELRAAYHRWMS
jgi:hypothetical protein